MTDKVDRPKGTTMRGNRNMTYKAYLIYTCEGQLSQSLQFSMKSIFWRIGEKSTVFYISLKSYSYFLTDNAIWVAFVSVKQYLYIRILQGLNQPEVYLARLCSPIYSASQTRSWFSSLSAPPKSQQIKFCSRGHRQRQGQIDSQTEQKSVVYFEERVVEPSAGPVTPPVTEPVLASTEEPLFCSSSTLGALPKSYSKNCITGTLLVFVESVTSTTSCMETLPKANRPDIWVLLSKKYHQRWK